MLDRLEEMFGGKYNPPEEKDVIEILTEEHDRRIDELKKKARRLIDIAYNCAIEDVLEELKDSLDYAEVNRLNKLKRVVRKG